MRHKVFHFGILHYKVQFPLASTLPSLGTGWTTAAGLEAGQGQGRRLFGHFGHFDRHQPHLSSLNLPSPPHLLPSFLLPLQTKTYHQKTGTISILLLGSSPSGKHCATLPHPLAHLPCLLALLPLPSREVGGIRHETSVKQSGIVRGRLRGS